MMNEQLSRTARLLGEESIHKLRRSRVAVFGAGGVGGYVIEALARAGVGSLELIDDDVVAPSNLNRQIIATRETLGMPKVEAFAERIRSIDPAIEVTCRQLFYLPEEGERFDFTSYDYVVDAIDTVSAKIDIICRCGEAGTPVISSMGCGNRIDPTALVIADISKTHTDPLARVMRRELKKRGIAHLPVLFSTEPPLLPYEKAPDAPSPSGESETETQVQRPGAPKTHSPGSVPFVPAAGGLAIASRVVLDLTGYRPEEHRRTSR